MLRRILRRPNADWATPACRDVSARYTALALLALVEARRADLGRGVSARLGVA